MMSQAYERTYGVLCGRHPAIRPWHFQWLAVKDLYGELRLSLGNLEGSVLDIGCGDKPYQAWLSRADRYVGVDVSSESRADVIVEPGRPWPLDTGSFDAVMSTQVLEHVTDIASVVSEIQRVLRPGGTVVVTLPFIYNEHGVPADYRRFSAYGAAAIFPSDWEVVRVERLGGVGSASGILFLNWVDASTNATFLGRLVKGVLLPVWIAISAFVNLAGALMDLMDRTSGFYVNVALVVRKPKL